MAVCYLQNKTLDDIYVTNNSIILILDGLEIPGNVGTIIRSADATDIDAIIINNRKTRLNHPKLIRSS
ncbi:MAG TPA: rRNA methyltransferase, partial [Clostridium sp.]|nr:rRNA methyltransferase [Clostridium sp.]